MRQVPEWFAGRIEPERHIEADDDGDPPEHADIDPWREASFDPTRLRRRQPHGLGDLVERQCGRPAGRSQVAPESLEQPPRAAVCAGDA